MAVLNPGDWVLFMNDMRSSNIEYNQPVCSAATKEALIEFYRKEMVESYSDGQWGKSFRKGGPLEWFNALDEEFNGYCFQGLQQYIPEQLEVPSIEELGG